MVCNDVAFLVEVVKTLGAMAAAQGVAAVGPAPGLAELGGDAREMLSAQSGRHYAGLGQAVHDARAWLPSAVAKKFRRTEIANAELRHYTKVGAEGVLG